MVIERKMKKHEVIVLATMSSGKSTLINALLGNDLLPNENQACTAKIFRIIDSDQIGDYKVNVSTMEGEVIERSINDLRDLNNDNEIKEIIISGDFKGVHNKKIANEIHQMTIVDTPGPNNSMDLSHGEIAYKLVEESETSYIIYVLNSTQIGINDDKKLLADLLDIKKKKKSDLEIVFLLNKADQIDPQKENIKDIKVNVTKYLENIGFINPKIIPISAYAAKLLKNGLEGNISTRKELFDFKFFYDYFENHSLTEHEYGNAFDEGLISIRNEEYSRATIIERLNKTGILDLERELNDFINEKIIKL